MRISAIKNRRDILLIKDRWHDFTVACDCSVPFMQIEWYLSSLETVDKDKTPLLLFFEESGKDMGFAPLVYKKTSRFGFPFHFISFINNAYTPFQGFLYTCDFDFFFKSLIEFIRHSFGAWFVLDLDELQLTSVENDCIDRLASGGHGKIIMGKKSENRFLALKESFQATIDSLDKKVKHEFSRKRSRLGRLGNIGLKKIEKPKEIREHLDLFFTLYARTWKGAEPCPDFYYRVSEAFARLGKLFFVSLVLNGAPIAYLIGFIGGSTVYGVKTTYDPSFYAFSPGVMLFYHAIEESFSLPGIRFFDFGRGNEKYKNEWTSMTRKQVRLRIEPDHLMWRIARLIKNALFPVITGINSLRDAVLNGASCKNKDTLSNNSNKIDYSEGELIIPQNLNAKGPKSLYARFAVADDADRLAVAMEAQNLQEVKCRLQKETCIVIEVDKQLMACFWLGIPAGMGQFDQIDHVITVRTWKIRFAFETSLLAQQSLDCFAQFLRSHGYSNDRVKIPYIRNCNKPCANPYCKGISL